MYRWFQYDKPTLCWEIGEKRSSVIYFILQDTLQNYQKTYPLAILLILIPAAKSRQLLKITGTASSKKVLSAQLNGCKFGIDTGGSKPVCCRKQSYDPCESKIIMEQVAQLLSNKWIDRCKGPWGSVIFLYKSLANKRRITSRILFGECVFHTEDWMTLPINSNSSLWWSNHHPGGWSWNYLDCHLRR